MRNLLLILLLLVMCNLSAQEIITKRWYMYNSDSVRFKSVKINDTTWNYNGESTLSSMVIKNDTLKQVDVIRNDTLINFYKCVKTVDYKVTYDNRCNGITKKGKRCKISVSNSKGKLFCFWHK